MFKQLSLALAIALVPALVSVAETKDDVTAAVKKLSDATSYSWKTTSEGGAGARGGAGATEGKIEKDGFTWYSITRGNNSTEVLFKGDKGAVKLADGWKSFEEASAAPADAAATPARGGNPGRTAVRAAKAFKSPAAQAQELADKATGLAKADDAIGGTLPEDVAKALMTPAGGGGRRGAAAGGAAAAAPAIANAKGTVKFWIKDGVVTKFQTNVTGTMSRNGNDTEVNRTTTVELSDIGTAKVEIPAEAKAKVGA